MSLEEQCLDRLCIYAVVGKRVTCKYLNIDDQIQSDYLGFAQVTRYSK